MRLARLISFVLFSLLFAVAAQAQSVRWGSSESGMLNTVQLVFDSCAPDGEPQLPSYRESTAAGARHRFPV